MEPHRFDHLRDDQPPEPDAAALDRVRRRASQLRRHRSVAVASASVFALVLCLGAVTVAVQGSGDRTRVRSIPGGTSSSPAPSNTTSTLSVTSTRPAGTTTTTVVSGDPATAAPCALGVEGAAGADSSHPERAPLQGAKVFGSGRDRWAICGGSTTYSDALLSVRSTDSGRTWRATDTGLATEPFHAGDRIVVTLDDFRVGTIRLLSLAAGFDRSYRTTDGGATWLPVPASSPTPGVHDGPPRMAGGCTAADSPPPPTDLRHAIFAGGSEAQREPQRVDIDGDGRPDDVYPTAGDTSGVSVWTAAGDLIALPVPTAKPFDLLATDVGGRGVILVDLWGASENLTEVIVMDHCSLQFATNRSGQPYQFIVRSADDAPPDAGAHTSTGVGCLTDASGRPTALAGLSARVDGTVVHWTRTTVELRGTTLRNGSIDTGTYVLPRDAARAALLGELSCGGQVAGS